MADIKLRIEVNPGAGSQTMGSIVNNSATISNASVKTNNSDVFINIPTSDTAESGSNGLAWAVTDDLVFDDGDFLIVEDETGNYVEDEQSPIEFIWGVVPANGEYSVSLTFSNAESLKDVAFYGDTIANQFPIEAVVDGTTLVSDDPQWVIGLDPSLSSHTIVFTKWNRPNYNACLSLISIMLEYIDFDKDNGLKSVESLTQSTSSPEDIFYGTIANSGNAQILDINGELEDYIRDGALDNSNVPIKVYANGNLIQTHITDGSSYTKGAKVLSLSMSNTMKSLDSLTYKGYPYPDESKTAYEMLYDVMYNLKNSIETPFTPTIFDQMFSASIKTLLQGISITYPYIEANVTYREAIEQFCNLAQLNCFLDDEGNIKFVNARPIFNSSEQTPIKINSRDMFEPLKYDLVLKNKYQGVEINDTLVKKTTQYDSVVDTQSKLFDTSWVQDIQLGEMNSGNKDVDVQIASNLGNMHPTVAEYIKIKNYYTSGTIYIPYYDESHLNAVTEILDKVKSSDNQYYYTVNYRKYIDSTSDGYCSTDGTITSYSVDLPTTISDDYPYTIEQSMFNFSLKYTTDASAYGIRATASVNAPNESSLTITKDDLNERFIVEYNLLVGQDTIHLNESGTYVGTVSSIHLRNGTSIRQIPTSVELSVYGNKTTIEFESLSESSEGIESLQSIASIPDNILRQTDNGQTATIKTNILSDYANGIHTAATKVQCGNYYDSAQNLAKDWQQGQVFDIGDVVYFDNDYNYAGTQRYWKVVGRRFEKTGVPFQALELQECYAQQ